MKDYFGTYHRFETESKKDAGALLSANNLVGDVYSIEDEIEDGEHRAWIISRFDGRIGFFDASFSRELSVMQAQGLTCKAILSFVAFTESESEGYYWGEMAVICFNPAYSDSFDNFITNVGQRISEGVRPVLELDPLAVTKVIDSNGTWLPTQTMPTPEKIKGTAIMKQRRSMLDKAVVQGRAGNKGCYFISWIFLLAVVALVVWGLFNLFS